MSGPRSISDQLSEALSEGSMFDELSDLEERFIWEEESQVAGTPSKEDPTTDEALEPEELRIQADRLKKATAKVEKGVSVSMSADTPGDFLVTVSGGKNPVELRTKVAKVEKAIRNLGFFVTPSRDGKKLYVYAETPKPPPMDGGGGGAPPPPQAKPKPKPGKKPKDEEGDEEQG